MKKSVFAVSVIIALTLLCGASVWEGAAAVSPEFPESGLYVATNSFPRNTVVDLTNLETGKTVRVIVSAGLDTPGLLAQVSREAADAIGLRSRSVGRIRMIVPSDPVALSGLPEEYRSGDPDFDPLAAVDGVYGVDADSSAVAADSSAADADTPAIAADIPETAPDVPAVSAVVPAVAADTPEAAPEPVPPAADTAPASDMPLRGDPESVWTDVPFAAIVPAAEESPAVVETPPALIPEETPAAEEPSNAVVVAIVPDPAPIAEIPPAPETPPEPEPVVAEPPAAVTEPSYEYSYTLVPAGERPPTPGAFSDGIPPVPASVPQLFSVPAIAELEPGKYYLQIGAYAQIPAVEQELRKIDRNYPLTVQCISLSAKPAYRILIGPVNQGEAGALLRKYAAKGYNDAFVRRAP